VLANLDYLWKVASYTPKIQRILVHALDHMKGLQGIGDMLEDDVEHINQMAARIET
jgi:predicted small metal-binding protein